MKPVTWLCILGGVALATLGAILIRDWDLAGGLVLIACGVVSIGAGLVKELGR